MGQIRARMLLEKLESRAMLTTFVGFNDSLVRVINDTVGTVDVNVGMWSSDNKPAIAQTVTLTTTSVSAVPGVITRPSSNRSLSALVIPRCKCRSRSFPGRPRWALVRSRFRSRRLQARPRGNRNSSSSRTEPTPRRPIS